MIILVIYSHILNSFLVVCIILWHVLSLVENVALKYSCIVFIFFIKLPAIFKVVFYVNKFEIIEVFNWPVSIKHGTFS